jgi:hypothetical protein
MIVLVRHVARKVDMRNESKILVRELEGRRLCETHYDGMIILNAGIC